MRRVGKNVWFAGCLAAMLLSVASCTSVKNMKIRKVVPSPKPVETTSVVTGVVLENDDRNGELKLRYLDSESLSDLFYDEASVIQDEYGKERSGEHIEVGEILDVEYLPDTGTIKKVSVPKGAWHYYDVQKFAFDADESTLEFVGRKYQYDMSTLCYSGSEEIQPMDFDSQDVLKIRGIGGHVYSVIRTQGHGYIRLANYADFIGGMAEVGDALMLPIKENMLITVTEGTYRLKLLNHGMAAAKTVVVENGGDVTVDFSDYKREVKDIGEVIFDVRPNGAELTINGTPIDYSKPVTLNYGKYKVKVTLAGYEDYIGVLSVGVKTPKTIHIALAEANAEVNLPSATPAPKATTNVTENNTVTRKIDGKHTITVTAPAGAEVYVDNIYKGLVPCTFTKIIGSQTFTLKDSGHVTKEYSVDVLDDNKNVKLSFAELEDDPASTSGDDSTSEPENGTSSSED